MLGLRTATTHACDAPLNWAAKRMTMARARFGKSSASKASVPRSLRSVFASKLARCPSLQGLSMLIGLPPLSARCTPSAVSWVRSRFAFKELPVILPLARSQRERSAEATCGGRTRRSAFATAGSPPRIATFSDLKLAGAEFLCSASTLASVYLTLASCSGLSKKLCREVSSSRNSASSRTCAYLAPSSARTHARPYVVMPHLLSEQLEQEQEQPPPARVLRVCQIPR